MNGSDGLPKWEEAGRLVLSELRESKEWRERFESKFDRLAAKVTGWAAVIAFVAFVVPLIVVLLLKG